MDLISASAFSINAENRNILMLNDRAGIVETLKINILEFIGLSEAEETKENLLKRIIWQTKSINLPFQRMSRASSEF